MLLSIPIAGVLFGKYGNLLSIIQEFLFLSNSSHLWSKNMSPNGSKIPFLPFCLKTKPQSVSSENLFFPLISFILNWGEKEWSLKKRYEDKLPSSFAWEFHKQSKERNLDICTPWRHNNFIHNSGKKRREKKYFSLKMSCMQNFLFFLKANPKTPKKLE